MKRIVLEPGPKPNTVFLRIPDCVLQFMGWHEGDALELRIQANDDLIVRWADDQTGGTKASDDVE
jgi:antitoxin component of MazEF toxin-antitoxin module